MQDATPVVRALEESELDAALDLISAQWAEIPRACNEGMIRHDPWRSQQRSFGAFADGRLVAHARFHHRPVRLGRARLRMVGVCEVVTHPDYRRRGFGHQVLKAALRWLWETRQHFAMLYTGVHPFYAALGWGATREGMYYVPTSAIPRLGEGGCRITHIPAQEAPPEFAAIYEESCGQHPISLDRTSAYWEGWPRWAEGNRWFGLLGDMWTAAWEGSRIVAYGGISGSILREKALSIVEACAPPEHQGALFDVCDDLVARCRAAGAERIELNLPSDHPLVSRLAPVGEQGADGSAMLRVVDLRALLEALMPELEGRSAGLPNSTRVRLESPLGSATLSADQGSVAVDESRGAPRAELSPAGLGSLLLGFRTTAELGEAGEIEAAAATMEVLDVLFPCLHSHYWQIDHF